MMKYRIVGAWEENLDVAEKELATRVEKHLAAGWELHGSPSISTVVAGTSVTHILVQAMTRKGDE